MQTPHDASASDRHVPSTLRTIGNFQRPQTTPCGQKQRKEFIDT
ncbi:hypothetical protein RSSM_00272 [Rhodopirellula sallentina SM41]|uniref:Uncharacterized protein n=1 Tax=Rhodopirellula sallentina SM41 TaxID=1263870 RepID=M5UQM6_9BACT|nr:hypothetical protein RSSM_00272 [Rhodopirellula sallentina SM41]